MNCLELERKSYSEKILNHAMSDDSGSWWWWINLLGKKNTFNSFSSKTQKEKENITSERRNRIDVGEFSRIIVKIIVFIF